MPDPGRVSITGTSEGTVPAMQTTTLPPDLERWLDRRFLGITAVRDASWPRADSRVWYVRGSHGDGMYVKISRTPERYTREVNAYRRAPAVLGAGRAPRLVAADERMRAIVTSALPGRLALAGDVAPDREREMHRSAGALLGRWHEHESPSSTSGERHRAVAGVAGRVAQLHDRLRDIDSLLDAPQRRLAEDARTRLPALAEVLPLRFRHGDFQPRNWQWDAPNTTVALLDFEEAGFGLAVEDFTWLFGVSWRADPHLETACLDGYGRALTEEERHALPLFAALVAVDLIHTALATDDTETLIRARFLYGRIAALHAASGH
jgi:Ser/Thr protein kinase RdoA (MazF antagonist)